MRSLKYTGTMVFQGLNDEQVRANYQHKHVVDYFIKYFKGKKVLDAGCWTGTMEKQLLSQGVKVEVVGIDENRDALKVASKSFPEFKFIRCNLDKPSASFIKKYKGYFDTIIYLDVIEHVPVGTEAEIMKFFHKVLKPGGVIILSTMADHMFNFIDPAWFFGHRHYKKEELLKIFSDGGFRASEILMIGNLYWDLDLLLLYIHKHILKKQYITSNFIYQRILKGLNSTALPTRFYALLKKK